MQEQKQEYMRQALALAQRGAGHVNPNPMVGCVIVKDGKIIGEGWHEHIGGLHAERNAFAHCTEDCSRAATGDARRRAQTQSSSTRSAACSSAASTRTRW